MDYRNNDTRYGPAPCSLRVLCLHDSNSNASKLSYRLEALGERLYEKHGIDLVYVNSPLLKLTSSKGSTSNNNNSADATTTSAGDPATEKEMDSTVDDNDDDGGYDSSNPKIDPRDRVWWEEAVMDAAHASDEVANANRDDDDLIEEKNGNDKTSKTDSDSSGKDDKGTAQPDNNHDDDNTGNSTLPPTSKRYVGLDASLLLLRQIWTSMPFWGVLAIGDSAAVASFLPLLPVDPFPSFGIFINGNTLLGEEDTLLEDWPCLHIVGTCVNLDAGNLKCSGPNQNSKETVRH